MFSDAPVPIPQNMYGQPLPYGSMPVPPPPPGMHYSYPHHHQPMQPGLEHMLPGALPGPVVYPGYPHAPPGGPMVLAQHMGQVWPAVRGFTYRILRATLCTHPLQVDWRSSKVLRRCEASVAVSVMQFSQ
jgi:hypothetical protein